MYYYLGEALLKVRRDAEAVPYFDRLVKEFETSEYLDEAKARLSEFKDVVPPATSGTGDKAQAAPAGTQAPAAPGTSTGTPAAPPGTPVIEPSPPGTPATPPPPVKPPTTM